MTLYARKTVFAAKTEATIGTAETLTTAEGAFNAFNVIIDQDTPVDERQGQGGFGMLPSVPGGYGASIKFQTDMGWDSTLTEPSWADILLPACGVVKTSQVFTPRSEAPGTNVKTLTIAAYVDGTRKIARGCAGTAKFTFPVGKRAYIDWDFKGIWVDPTDVTMLAPTYPATDIPLRFAGTATTYNSVALACSQLVLDLGNTVILNPISTDVSGFSSAIVTNRNPKVTCDPLARLLATRNPWAQFKAMTEAVLAWGLNGASSSVISFSAPKAQIIKNTQTNRDMLVADSLEFQLNRNGSTADQEFSITFTP